MKKISIYTVILFCFVFISSFRSPYTSGLINPIPTNKFIDASDTFPVPSGNKKMLFYVQRTHNTNTIVYELNYAKDSTLDAQSPVHPYWIRYADQGEIKELSYIQSQYAYGLTSELVDKEKQTFKVNFVSYKKKDIFLIRSKTNHQYAAYISINGKLSRLEKIFAKIEGGTFWVPHITYVEVTGKDLAGKSVSEKIIP
jgi:hypothetical protein